MSVIKWVYYNKRDRRDMITITHSEPGCEKSRTCSCDWHVKFTVLTDITETTIRRDFNGQKRTMTEMVEELAIFVQSDYDIGPCGPFPRHTNRDDLFLKSRIANSPNMKLEEAPFRYNHTPMSKLPPAILPSAIMAVKVADFSDVQDFDPTVTAQELDQYVFRGSDRFVNPNYIAPPIPKLRHLALRALTEFNRIFGHTIGEDGVARPHVINAMAGLETDRKYVDTLLKMSKPLVDVTPVQRAVLSRTDESLDRLYYALGVEDKIGKYEAKIFPHFFAKVPLHAANGLYPCEVRSVVKVGVKYVVSANAHKYENYYQVMKALFTHLDKREPFAVYWTISPKSELKFSTEKQMDAETFRKWVAKHRIIVIASSIFVYAERIVSFLFKLLTYNTDSKIGHKWPHGGADKLIEDIDLENTSFGDGDFTELDLHIHQVLMKIFYSQLLVFYGKGPHREDMEWLADQLAGHVVSRLTHLLGDIWARIIALMPSGAWDTSIGDSWIVLFLYYLFISCTLHDIEDEDLRTQVETELLLRTKRLYGIKVYGDDHFTFSNKNTQDRFGERAFARWLEDVWNMPVRDQRQGISAITTTHYGELADPGIVFLQHYIIANFIRSPEAPKYLPFRPKSKICMKVVWGRNGDLRRPVDILLSAIGTAYGLMGVNPRLHSWLQVLYDVVLMEIPGGLASKEVQEALPTFNLRKLRQYSVTVELLLRGFPSLAAVQRLNFRLDSYHTVDRTIEVDPQFSDDEE